ncbi:MAG: hypothetical protein ACE5HQ_01395 [Gemmatimonadota bacterium]
MKIPPGAVRDGVIAGVLAGTVLAILFYFYDLGQGTPLRTPAFLLGAITGRGELGPSVAVVAVYTVLHYAVWSALGVIACLLLLWADIARNVLLGAAYGLFACSILFYGGLALSGSGVLAAPAWPAVFFGNALAGMVIFAYLHAVSREPGILGLLSFLRTHRTMRQGLISGLVGATIVALWFLVVDSIAREPLFTPAALGSILFAGGRPGPDGVGLGPILGYTLVHFAAFGLFGVILAGITDQIERFPPLVFGLLILFVAFEVFFVAMVAVLGSWVLEEIAWWSVMVGNLLAALGMGAYMWKAHPALRGRLQESTLWQE